MSKSHFRIYHHRAGRIAWRVTTEQNTKEPPSPPPIAEKTQTICLTFQNAI